MALDNRGARVLLSDPETGLRLLGVPRQEPGAGWVTIHRLDGPPFPEHLISYSLTDRAEAERAYGVALEWLRSQKRG